MDKLKDIGGHLKKFHFWILCGVVAVVGLGSWYMSKAALHEEFTTNKGEIDAGYTSATALTGTPDPPNPTVHQEMKFRIQALQSNVMQVWEAQYEHQKNTILTWPEELTRRFRNMVEPLRPIESKVPGPQETTREILPQDLRAEYANYIDRELPKLAEIIGANWQAKKGAARGFGGSGGFDSGYEPSYEMPDEGMGGYGSSRGSARRKESTFVVDWSQSDQNQILAKFTWPGAPTTLQIMYAQEDLWVLKNVMEIINRTNDGATERHKAFIKKIDSIQIGREATRRTGRITPIAATGASTMPGEGEGYPGSTDMAMDTDTAMPGGESDAGMPGGEMYGSGGAAAPVDPAEMRYVDKDYQPLPAAKLRSDVTQNPAEVYLAVAKRMPVRLVCQMDQRKIHKLLVECGNSPLTVEVRQVRIGGNAGKGSQGGYGGGSSGFEESSFGGFDTPGGGGESGYAGLGGYGSSRGAVNQSNDVVVEIYGIVYIYNPVNLKALGIDPSQGPVDPGALTADAGGVKTSS